MSMVRIRYVSKKTGEAKVYEYEPRDYYMPAIERARLFLNRRPLKRVRSQRVTEDSSPGFRWTAGQRGPVFNHATIQQLLNEGYAVCVGDFVEIKGVVR